MKRYAAGVAASTERTLFASGGGGEEWTTRSRGARTNSCHAPAFAPSANCRSRPIGLQSAPYPSEAASVLAVRQRATRRSLLCARRGPEAAALRRRRSLLWAQKPQHCVDCAVSSILGSLVEAAAVATTGGAAGDCAPCTASFTSSTFFSATSSISCAAALALAAAPSRASVACSTAWAAGDAAGEASPAGDASPSPAGAAGEPSAACATASRMASFSSGFASSTSVGAAASWGCAGAALACLAVDLPQRPPGWRPSPPASPPQRAWARPPPGAVPARRSPAWPSTCRNGLPDGVLL
eukprot:CAMPEP_0176304630 /NCGR_PEP_ID=MMETSP0121_2-20121125/62529_1 /TAXON_ID=160619 /ORGANISM="Kryptoperidinium foliaceum, Strain CCMP 1326" /LENGTH=296 /DNA_ID=CAMNT_0017646241 /DNA_START=47 /DNA_END=934 /DNA_ORIENTATION=+